MQLREKNHITFRFKDDRIWSIRFSSFRSIASFCVFDSEATASDSVSTAMYRQTFLVSPLFFLSTKKFNREHRCSYLKAEATCDIWIHTATFFMHVIFYATITLPKAQDKRKLFIKTKLHPLFCFCYELQWPSLEELLKKMDKSSNNQANRSKLIVQRLNTFLKNHKLYVHFCTNRSQV